MYLTHNSHGGLDSPIAVHHSYMYMYVCILCIYNIHIHIYIYIYLILSLYTDYQVSKSAMFLNKSAEHARSLFEKSPTFVGLFVRADLHLAMEGVGLHGGAHA